MTVSIGCWKRTLAVQKVFENGLIATSFDPPLYSIDSTCARTIGSALISPSFGYLNLHVHNQTVGL